MCYRAITEYEKKLFEERLAEHKGRMKQVHAVVEQESPLVNIYDFVHAGSVRTDLEAYTKLLWENLDIWSTVNKFKRVPAVVSAFPDPPKKMFMRDNHFRLEMARQLTSANRKYLVRLHHTKATFQTRTIETPKDIRKRSRQLLADFVPPDHILDRIPELDFPRNPKLLRRLFRPQIFLDFEVQDVRPLGRAIIQLYTEAAPLVVREFMIACAAGDVDKIVFPRLFKDLWADGFLTMEKGSPLQCRQPHDELAINHMEYDCTVCFHKRYLDGFHGTLPFHICFRKITVQHECYVTFGKICTHTSKHVIRAMQDFATKRGRPIKKIVVTHCGLIR